MAGEEILGLDIKMNFDNNDLEISNKDDFKVINTYDNLKQAIISRLKTKLGEDELHPNYGSRIPDLIGQSATDDLLLLARMYVREALNQEPRIQEITRLSVTYSDNLRTTIRIEIDVNPIGETNNTNIVFDFIIAGVTA